MPCGDNLEGMNYGVIHHVVFDKGFGFIKPDRGPDIFFPAIAVQDGRFNFIGPEQPVKYELEPESFEEREKRKETKKGPRAKLVILLDKMPGGVLEDTPGTMRAKHHPNKKGRKPNWKRKIDVAGPMDKPLPEIRPVEEVQPEESGDGSQVSGEE